MQSPSETIMLRRTVVGRLFGGFRLQPVFTTIGVLLLIALVHQAVTGSANSQNPLWVLALVFIAVAGITAVGATGWARADPGGITWRYYRRRHVAWDEVEVVWLQTKGTGIAGLYESLDVHTTRRRLRILPASGGTRASRLFGRELLGIAAAHGCETRDAWRR